MTLLFPHMQDFTQTECIVQDLGSMLVCKAVRIPVNHSFSRKKRIFQWLLFVRKYCFDVVHGIYQHFTPQLRILAVQRMDGRT